VGYVAQDFGFFDGTVAQNIARLGTVDAEQVVLAAQRVGMHEVILNFPQGYNTPLRDGSTFMMSGGQKQRLAIARAIYNTPKLLVLDEPNSALDESGEHLLGKLIRDLSALGTTIVAITHRPALVSLAHNLMVLQAGRMVKFGPTTEVIEWSQRNKVTAA
jgi:ABC-type protease/lipase transport system fused ATPase/permease subunit